VADSDHVVYGLHAAEAVLGRRIKAVRSAVLLEGGLKGRLGELAAALAAASIPVERARRDRLDQLARGGVHQGIVLRVPPPREQDLATLERLVEQKPDSLRLLILDQVEDPRNLGACLRTADAAGIDAVVVPKARSVKLSAAALKAAAGAAETVPVIVVPNLARTLRWLSDANIRLIGADAQGDQTLYDADLTPPVGIVLGAEGKGLRRLTRESCDDLIQIPMLGTVDSLNVSVAAGIVLYEVVRQSAHQMRQGK
jgi:23S rRNA (guanosine2251-2'-O)-methyltransferase